jgi:hypothetical protein
LVEVLITEGVEAQEDITNLFLTMSIATAEVDIKASFLASSITPTILSTIYYENNSFKNLIGENIQGK